MLPPDVFEYSSKEYKSYDLLLSFILLGKNDHRFFERLRYRGSLVKGSYLSFWPIELLVPRESLLLYIADVSNSPSGVPVRLIVFEIESLKIREYLWIISLEGSPGKSIKLRYDMFN